MKKLLLALTVALIVCLACSFSLADGEHPIDDKTGRYLHEYDPANGFTVVESLNIVRVYCTYDEYGAPEEDEIEGEIDKNQDFKEYPLNAFVPKDANDKHTFPELKDFDLAGKTVKEVLEEYKNVVSYTPATCLENGSITVKCKTAGHDAVRYDEVGKEEYKFYKACGETKTLTIKATGHHIWSDADTDEAKAIREKGNLPQYIETKAATCTETGTLNNYCLVCKELGSKVLTTDALGHKWDAKKTEAIGEPVITEPTCVARGSKIQTYKKVCGVCGFETQVDEDLAKDDPEYDLDNTAHVWGTWLTESRVEPTCPKGLTKDDEGKGKVGRLVEYRLCKLCLAAKEVRETELAAGHVWEAVTVTPATCKEVGKEKYVCKYCAQTCLGADGKIFYGEIAIDENAHPAEFRVLNESASKNVKGPTCTADSVLVYDCGLCGAEEVATITTKALGHAWAETIDPKSECTEVVKACTRCGLTPDKLDAKDKDYDADYEPTKLAEPAHDWGKWIERNAPSDETPGYWFRQCNRCGKHEEVIGNTAPEGVEPVDPDDPVTPDDPDDPVDPEPEKDPEYKAVDGKFDADEMMVSGKVEHVDGTGEVETLYARVTFFMADGTFTVTTAPVVDGAYEAMNSGDIIHIAVQVTNTNKVKPGDFNSYGAQEFDVE
ncbi:MAG: hypothetical protein IJM56_09080 [Clostridia bacterium]|nr:hypothetical protein [Clostridia bacterium]